MSGEERAARKVARSLLLWVERHADPADRQWIGGMRAELEVIDGSLAQLSWAAGALPLLWRPYRLDVVRFALCIAVVVVANYAYPKFATSRVVELFFFAQQLYLPAVGSVAAHATRRVLTGTVVGVVVSLLGFGVLHALGYGSPDATRLMANGSPGMYIQILLFALVGAAFGALGAVTLLRTSRQAIVSTP